MLAILGSDACDGLGLGAGDALGVSGVRSISIASWCPSDCQSSRPANEVVRRLLTRGRGRSFMHWAEENERKCPTRVLGHITARTRKTFSSYGRLLDL